MDVKNNDKSICLNLQSLYLLDNHTKYVFGRPNIS